MSEDTYPHSQPFLDVISEQESDNLLSSQNCFEGLVRGSQDRERCPFNEKSEDFNLSGLSCGFGDEISENRHANDSRL